MKSLKNKKDITIFFVFVVGLLISIIFFIWNPFSGNQNTNTQFFSINEAVKKEKLSTDEKVISVNEFDEIAFVLIDDNNSLRILNYEKTIKNNQTVYEKKVDSKTENFFSDDKKHVDREMFEKILNNSRDEPKFTQSEKEIRMYSTINKKELELKINNEKANEVVEYERNGTIYYFMYFTNIDYSNEMTFNY